MFSFPFDDFGEGNDAGGGMSTSVETSSSALKTCTHTSFSMKSSMPRFDNSEIDLRTQEGGGGGGVSVVSKSKGQLIMKTDKWGQVCLRQGDSRTRTAPVINNDYLRLLESPGSPWNPSMLSIHKRLESNPNPAGPDFSNIREFREELSCDSQ